MESEHNRKQFAMNELRDWRSDVMFIVLILCNNKAKQRYPQSEEEINICAILKNIR